MNQPSCTRSSLAPVTSQEHTRLMDEEVSSKRLEEMAGFESFLVNFKFPTKPQTIKLTMTQDEQPR